MIDGRIYESENKVLIGLDNHFLSHLDRAIVLANKDLLLTEKAKWYLNQFIYIFIP